MIDDVSAANILVVGMVGGSKFYQCQSLEIPIVAHEWLLESEKQHKFLDPVHFKPPALYNFVICVSGKMIGTGTTMYSIIYMQRSAPRLKICAPKTVPNMKRI